jgi:hypothetical protein
MKTPIRTPHWLTRLRIQEAVELVRGGMTRIEAARRAGVSVPSVSTACRAAGIGRGKAGRPAGRYDPKWLAVDWSRRNIDIARAMGVSHTRVYQVRRALQRSTGRE